MILVTKLHSFYSNSLNFATFWRIFLELNTKGINLSSENSSSYDRVLHEKLNQEVSRPELAVQRQYRNIQKRVISS